MLIKSTTCRANTQGFFWKKSANAQNFCNFLALGQQQAVLIGQNLEHNDEHDVHEDRHDDGAEAGDGTAHADAAEAPVGQPRRAAHENGGFDFVLKPPFFISRKSAVSGSVRMIYKT